jgi:hypothetical protein
MGIELSGNKKKDKIKNQYLQKKMQALIGHC